MHASEFSRFIVLKDFGISNAKVIIVRFHYKV